MIVDPKNKRKKAKRKTGFDLIWKFGHDWRYSEGRLVIDRKEKLEHGFSS